VILCVEVGKAECNEVYMFLDREIRRINIIDIIIARPRSRPFAFLFSRSINVLLPILRPV
jgi:hypothetical protein